MRSRQFFSVRELLPQTLGKWVQRTGTASALQPLWQEIVGPNIARHSSLFRFESGVLRVLTTGRAWEQELIRQKSDILHRMNEAVPSLGARDIQFQTPENV